MNVKEIVAYLDNHLTEDLKQEISDKIHVLHSIQKQDGKGLSTGIMVETVLQELFKKQIEDYEPYHIGQADMKICSQPISFKKVGVKSCLALNWSKNEKITKPIFEHPILILHLEDKKWWERKTGFNEFIPRGFYMINAEFCNENVQFKSNNKTNSLINAENVYKMLIYAKTKQWVLFLPPPNKNKYTYSLNYGFQINEQIKWPALPYSNKNLRFIDLFCGIGGFHQAMKRFNYTCVFACDIDKECQENYQLNYNIVPEGDIRDIKESDIPPFDILCAGFPCQPFSKAGNQLGFQDKTKGTLFWEILRILNFHKPRYFILENVKNMISHDKGNTWNIMKEELRNIGYSIPHTPYIFSPLHFNIPQNRERAIVIGIFHPKVQFPVLSLKEKETCIESIIEKNPDSKMPLEPKYDECGRIWENFCIICKTHDIKIPRFPIWTDWWDKIISENDVFYKKYKNWIDKNKDFFNKHRQHLNPWLLESRNNKFWIGAVRKLEWQCDETSLTKCLWTFRGSGIRVRNLSYSPTLVAMAMIPIYGPEWRFLTPRELCRLQDFPSSFKPCSNKKSFYKQIGNSVNVQVIQEAFLQLQALEKKLID